MAGSYGSRRWDRADTRLDTDSALHLDVRLLARLSLLSPGTHGLTWTRGAVSLGSVTLHVDSTEPDAVVLAYAVEDADRAPRPVVERVALARTRCHYGGSRPWFRCPGCHLRRAVLYGVGGMFRCRVCHDLAYGSTRETTVYRMVRPAETIQGTLGGARDGGVYLPPPRPTGMHRQTYRRLCARLEACQLRAIAAGLRGR